MRLTLSEVVSQRLFEVADYQRPYAWESKQLQDLWDDLDLLGSGHHYAGTIVLKAIDGPKQITIDGDRLARYEVVDGQQRLTTCFLLIDRLIKRLRHLQETGDEGVGRAITKLVDNFGQVTISGVRKPRLSLGADLNEFWKEQVLLGKPIIGSILVAGEQRLQAAAEFFDERLAFLVSGVDDTTAIERLLDLRGRVTAGLKFLVYEVESDAEVGVIFETLNERGRGLTDVEKVKNYLLYLAGQLPDDRKRDLAALINSKWSEIFKELARLPSRYEERLLRSHWLATQEPDARQWKRTASLKAKFPRSKYVPGSDRLAHTREVHDSLASEVIDASDHVWTELYEDIKAYVESLHACATFIGELHDPSAQYHSFASDRERARRATSSLNRSPVTALFLPLLFAWRLSHPTDGAGYAGLVELCEKYSARVFAIAQRRSNAGEPYLCKIAHGIYLGKPVDESMAALQALLWDYAPDSVVEQALLATDNWYGRQSHKYLLYEYELWKAKSPFDVKPWSDFIDTGNRRTTEHVLPQNPDPDSEWWNSYSEEEHKRLQHTLGNLVLTYDNSSYSNKEYAAKRGVIDQVAPPCYYTASLAQEREIASWEVWTPASIVERQEQLARWAMERWGVVQPNYAALQQADAEVASEVEAAVAADLEESEGPV
ncbi:DUF262 domain-containing protein [Mycetocola sp. 2940]|uniref:DUF262 domain-containing protein n=1 Tax=Mycetocola sp. 2940 TaxID=3156452 RepID=UPI003391D12A